jgi:hypothetical protein
MTASINGSTVSSRAVFFAGFLVLTAGCSINSPSTNLQGDEVTYGEAVSDKFCQETEGLKYGSTQYSQCFKYTYDLQKKARMHLVF